MAKINGFRNILINLGIILFFIVLSYAYLSPLLEGKVLRMDDIEHHKGMSKELVDYREKTGEEAVWTNSMFGGMPGYMISVVYPGNLGRYVAKPIRKIFSTASFLILYLIGFYVLLLSLKVNRWLSVAGAIAFAFSSYFLIILGAGHMSKANAIAWLAPVIAGVLLAFRGKPVAGTLLFAAAFSLELLSGHLQITYYGFLMIALLGLVELIFAIREKMLPAFFKSLLFLLAGAVIAIGMNFSRLYTSWEYSKETIRGPSELTSNSENKTSGLDKDYVVQWSYGIDETLTLLIPNFKGGGSLINPGVDSESFRALQSQGVQNPRQTIQAVSMYHGDQPGTSGPVYVGAIVIFLFVLGLFVLKGRIKWWLVSATVISIVLSWGGNIMWLTSFLLDYLPFYNKFRAPSMTLVIAELTIPLLGIIGLNDILAGKVDKKIWLNGLKWSFVITGGVSLLFAVMPGISGSFTNATDAMRFPEWLMDSVIADRKSMFRADAFRSFLFIALAAGALYLWQAKKIKTVPLVAVVGVLILVDLWAVDKRYLNNDNFVPSRQAENPFPITPVDQAILQDKDLYYRVLPLQNPFQDARTSYYHKDIGGYHAAKLRRYQELIGHHIQPEMQRMVAGLQAGSSIDSVFGQLPVINMLNARYIIFDLKQAPIRNPHPLGNAWFVSDFKMVGNADDEIKAMESFNPEQTAIVDQRFMQHVQGVTVAKDAAGSIELTEYQPNYLKYNYSAATEQFTVFSDIYYDKGWNAYIDGKPVSHFRVNYVLRALVVPAGNHTIEFKFEPKSYYTGNKVSYASSFLLLLAILGYAGVQVRKRKALLKDNGEDE
ncbi:membrane protein YfhO [Mariniphaga anaerophila]|uniref:Membrane protein YfhO n=1 Tax=Mariniphaga anaerophila TaxID=1484053 RepID=A0A1M5BQV1_9BACT|nr:YfhO family protein [Mariniphaga anaerophila]SHF44963.1 membrane protein YfhO [Mariniphaga anaerophila]